MPSMIATSQAQRNEASVSAILENEMCGPENATRTAEATPEPGPNDRRASQATNGMVAVPAT